MPRPRHPKGRLDGGAEPASNAAGPLFGSERARKGAVEGEVVRVTFESEASGFRVLRVAVDGKAEPEAWVGVFPPAAPGARVRATGRYVRDGKYGEQLEVETLLVVAPATLDGLERYLGSGLVKGIGPALAKRMVTTFRERTLEVLEREPGRLREVPGLGARRAEAVNEAWQAQRAVASIMVFLQTHGASPALAARLYRRFGAGAVDVLSRSPYRLALDVSGIGFKTADRLARSLGVSPDSPERAQAGVLQTMYDMALQGHVLCELPDLVARACAMLERDVLAVEEAVTALSRAGRVRVRDQSFGETGVYLTDLHDAEVRLAERLGALVDRPPGDRDKRLAAGVPEAMAAFEKGAGVTLAPAQREAIEHAARHALLVITGGPGVGKTTIVRAVLSVLCRAGLTVRLAAPTGRAAKRMSEATAREATTLHRLLEFDPKRRAFSRHRDNPIDGDAIIVDEASMLDLTLADALFQAVADGARVILVGDVDQLPSVGPGAVLRDVIASRRVPTVRLSQIFRQAEGSLIVRNAHRIHDGEPPESAPGKEGDFYVVERRSGEDAAATILDLVTRRIPRGFGLDPVREVQVLTPMHKGETGAIALNAALQATLNPHGQSITRGTRTLRVGDKVMQLSNDYERDVYNGDLGLLSGIDAAARTATVLFDEREVVYEEDELDEITLAYATTIHKSQGSEYPAVVIPVLTAHFVMLSRNLLYTAVTRGKRLVVLVADPRAVAIALGETRKEERRTGLASRLMTD